jgi:glutamate synthase (NADPH/NADH) large chain
MTGGTAVILGSTGRNLGAGMSGGVAYVLDLQLNRVNPEMIDLDPLTEADVAELHAIVVRHEEETGSLIAAELLVHWDDSVHRFTKVMPKDFKRVISLREQAIARGEDPILAVMGG